MKERSPVTELFEKQSLVHGGSALLILITVYCTIGAIVSAFSMPVRMGSLLLIWLISSIIVTAVTVIYRGKGLLVLLIPAFILFLFSYSSIVDGGMWVINNITSQYGNWLPVPELFPEAKSFTNNPGVFMGALGVAVSLLLAFSICLRRSVFLTIIITAPLIFLTFVITDLQPGIFYMFGILAVYLTLLISSAYSPDNFLKRGFIIIPALAAAILLMSIAYMFAPHGRYEREDHIAAISARLRMVASQMGRFGQFWNVSGRVTWGYNWLGAFDIGLWQFNTFNVNIADSGERTFSDQSLLEVTVSTQGTFYLRGYSMQRFNGRSWSNSDEMNLYDTISINWPSALVNAERMNSIDEQFRGQLIRRIEILQRIELLNNERTEIITNFAVPDIDEEELLDSESRIEEIEREIEALTDELHTLVNIPGTQARRVDIGRTMPALIAEFYDFEYERNRSVLTEMIINRTGDITAGIAYQPYFGSAHYREVSLTDDQEFFYYVNGNIHRLAATVFNSVDDTDNIYGSDIPAPLFPFNEELTEALFAYAEQVRSIGLYTEIDPSVAEELRQLAIDAGIDPYADRTTVVDAVARYVMRSGSYTLNPEPIPNDVDFTLYFLQESQGGYCIHFATAATMMLRALDIPARFTSGYTVRIAPWAVGDPVVLTDRDAHSWVEVFYDDIGWLYLEVTPAGGSTFIPEFRPHSPGDDDDVPRTPPPGASDGNYDDPDEDEYDPGEITPTNPSAPGSSGNDQPRRAPLPSWIQNTIIFISFIILSLIALVVRRTVVNDLRAKHFKQPDTNKAVISMWRYIMRLSNKEAVAPNDIEELALKARFSQHRITEEERDTVMKYANTLAFEIYDGKGDYSRLWLKYIRALC